MALRTAENGKPHVGTELRTAHLKVHFAQSWKDSLVCESWLYNLDKYSGNWKKNCNLVTRMSSEEEDGEVS